MEHPQAHTLWTPSQLQAMRGLGIPAWVGEGLKVQVQTQVEAAPMAKVALPEAPSMVQVLPSSPAAVNLSNADITALSRVAVQCNLCALSHTGRLPFALGNVGTGKGVFVVLDPAYATPDGLLSPPALTLLNAILGSVGHDFNTTAYASSTVKCGTASTLGSLDPLGDAITACAPYLQRQLQLKQAPLMIAMGAGAAQALMALDEPLSALRGELHGFECEGYAAQLLVTHHPQAVLEAPLLKRELWQDLCLAIDAGLLTSPVQTRKVNLR